MNTTITGKMPTQKDALEIDAATLLARRQEYVERLRRNVPQEMRERKWWVHHGLGKQPVQPNGKGLFRWRKAKHLTMDDALAALMKAPPDVAGVGVVLPKADKGTPLPAPPISCIDLDHCLTEDGTPKDAPGVQEILKRFGQHYMETSPSGGGLHIWYCGPWPPGVTTKTLFRGAEVEAWERNRFVTVTGNVWVPPGGTPTKELVEAGEEVGWLNRSLKTEGVPAGKAKDKADKTGADKEQPRQTADMERPAEPQRTDAATKITRPTPDRAELRKLLDEMPQDCRDNYAPWIDVGMAVHDATGASEEGWGLWDEWSRGSAKYKGTDETRRKWASFRTGGGRGIGTLYFYAGRTVPDSRPPEQCH